MPLGADLILDALETARDAGEGAVSRAVLQQEAALGATDLETALDWLRERGQLVEDAPGEYRQPYDDEVTADVVDERPQENGSGELVRPAVPRTAQAPGLQEPLTGATAIVGPLGAMRTVIPMSWAEALPPEALGALVAAGVKDAKSKGRACVIIIGDES
jgi:hypothetical protein